jgi:aspartyl/asparaginyl beta-hydroxylase (cupin superfamily)
MKKLKLDYHIFKGLINGYLSLYTGGKRRPVFFDIDHTYPELNEITRNCATIRAEFDRVLQTQNLPEYHDVDPGEKEISRTTANKWSVFMLDILGHKPEANRSLCPQTARILDGIPNLVQAFFSVLAPGKSIPLHEGPFYGYLRYHLALRVPRDNPPCIIVNSHKHVWKEGEAVLFDDSWPHEVVNHSQEQRVVLIVDVMRRMPYLPSLVNRFMTRVIARNTYGKKVAQRVEKFAPLFD